MRQPAIEPRRAAWAACAAALFIFVALALAAEARAEDPAPKPGFAATIHPVGAILREIAGDRASVSVMTPPGASPHVFEPRPSAFRAAEESRALFAVSIEHFEAWAKRFPAARRIEILPMIEPAALREYPEPSFEPGSAAHDHDHAHGAPDPHFWADPSLVRALVPKIAAAMAEADPEGRAQYEANARAFEAALGKLDAECAELLAPAKGRAVILFHPSLNYMLARYGLRLAASVEPSPGREPSPKYVRALIDLAAREKVKALFTEPQLPARPAEVIAEAARLPLFELDPNGGGEGRVTYAELILYNARTLAEALR